MTSLPDFIAAFKAQRETSFPLAYHALRFIPGDDTLVVTFMMALTGNARPLKPALEEEVWGGEYLRKKGHSILGVNRQRNDWYLSEDLHQTLTAIAEAGSFSQFRRVIFYGGSMGGFGALTFARLVPGCTVIAHNPQSTLHPAKTPWETRYNAGREYDWDGAFGDGAAGAAHASKVYVTYDPYCTEDRLHVDRLSQHNLVRLRVPFVGHQMPVWLQQLKLLGRIFESASDHSLTSEQFRQWARIRPQLGRYWLTLAQRRLNPAKKQYCAERARSLAPGDGQVKEFLWSITRRQKPAQSPRKWAFWASSEHDARLLQEVLASTLPSAPVLLDPFQDGARGYDMVTCATRATHRAMVNDDIQRHLSLSPTTILWVTPKDPAVDFAWVRALQQEGYEFILLCRGLLDTALPLPIAKQQAGLLRLLVAWMRYNGATVHRVPIDQTSAAHLSDPGSPLLTEISERIRRVHADKQLPNAATDEPGAPEQLLRLLQPGNAQAQPVLGLHLDIQQPDRLSLDSTLPAWAWGARVPVSGLSPPPVANPDATAIHVRQGARDQTPRWHQTAPGGVLLFRGQPTARQARFTRCHVDADPAQPVTIEVETRGQPPSGTLAQLRFTPLGDALPCQGLYLGPWSLGYLPLQGTNSQAICGALLALLPHGVGSANWPSDTKAQAERLAEWQTDISGAAYRFTVVADPVTRFADLHRCFVQAAAFSSLRAEHSLQAFVEQFDEHLEQRPSLAAQFKPQCELLRDVTLDGIFATDHPELLVQLLATRWGLKLAWPALQPVRQARSWRNWLRLSRSTEAEAMPTTVRDWILQRYADDVALHQKAGRALSHCGPT